MVTFIVLSGQYPFHGKTKDELLQKIRKEPVSFKSLRWKKISKEAKSMVAELLRKKPENRASIGDALRHAWLKVEASLPSSGIMQGIVETMIQFQELNMLQKAALTALAWRVHEDDTQHLRQIFEYLDQDANGHVTMGELRGAFAEVGVPLPEGLSICGVGTDGNDTIEYTEFLAAALDKAKVLKPDIVWEAFKIFDSDGSGTVTKAELCKLLAAGRTIDKAKDKESKAIEAFLDSYDTSGDGVVDFDEFMDMLDESRDGRRRKHSEAHDASEPSTSSYLGLCSTIASAACEKAQMSLSVPSGQSSKRTPRASQGKADVAGLFFEPKSFSATREMQSCLDVSPPVLQHVSTQMPMPLDRGLCVCAVHGPCCPQACLRFRGR